MKRRHDTLVRENPTPQTTEACRPLLLGDGRNAQHDGIERIELEVVSFDPSGMGAQLAIREDEARAWELDDFSSEDGDDGLNTDDDLDRWIDEYEAQLVVRSNEFLQAHCAQRDKVLGRVARHRYRARMNLVMRWAREKYVLVHSDFEVFLDALARVAWRRFVSQYSMRALREEKDDEVDRLCAAKNPHALAQYLQRVRLATAKWFAWRTHRPLRETLHMEIVSDCVIASLAAFREGNWETFERAGRAAFWKVRDSVIAEHRRRRRFWVVTDPLERIRPPTLRPDELLEREQLKHQWRDSVAEGLRPHLSKTQCRYLDAIIVELQLDGLYGLVTRVSQRLRRNKAQVSRAVERIRCIADMKGAADLFALAGVELAALDGAP